MMAEAPGQLLDWDSAFFGLRIARLEPRALAPGRLDALRTWAACERLDCVYYLAPEADEERWALAEAVGMRHVDTRVELSRSICSRDTTRPGRAIDTADDADREALRAIAAESHRDSRFFRDPDMPADRCGELYATWIDNSCSGFADAVLVARHEGSAVGYVSCKLESRDTGRIGLFAVAPAARGRGEGGRLVDAALAWFAGKGASWVAVATQQRNDAAIAHYVRSGFAVAFERRWYHWWPDRARHRAVDS